MHAKLLQSCLTLCDPMDCSLPGSSVHRILQASILEWITIPFSRGSSLPRDWTWISCIAGRFFTVWATREAIGSNREVIGRSQANNTKAIWERRTPNKSNHKGILQPLVSILLLTIWPHCWTCQRNVCTVAFTVLGFSIVCQHLLT